MSAPSHLGSSVHPPDCLLDLMRQWDEEEAKILQRWKERNKEFLRFLKGEETKNLAEDLLHKVDNGSLDQQSAQQILGESQKLEEGARKGETNNSKIWPGYYWTPDVTNNPDSFESTLIRQKIKMKAGNDFRELVYKVIHMIPDADWMEFARTVLKVHDDTERVMKMCTKPDTDMKFNMVRDWKERQGSEGQDELGKVLLDLAVDFMIRKGHDLKYVQQNFNGPIFAQNFNAMNRQRPCQASA